MNLTEQEIDVLIEALDDWVASGWDTKLVKGVLTGLSIKDRDKARSMFDEQDKEYNDKVRSRKIVATKLQAKLYELKESLLVEQVAEL